MLPLMEILAGIAIGVILGAVVVLLVRTSRSTSEPARHEREIGRLRTEHASEISALREGHLQEMGTLRTDHELAVHDLNIEHQGEVAGLKARHEEEILKNRQDAVDKSRSVIKGKIGEHMAPLLEEFASKYNLSEARFMGAPIDYIVFENLNDVDEKPVTVVLTDVKTGRAGLNKNQRRIEDAVKGGRVRWDVIRIEGGDMKTETTVVNDSDDDSQHSRHDANLNPM